MSSIDGKISCDHCGEYNHERSMVFTFRDSGKQFVCHTCADEFIENDDLCLDEIFFACDECGTMTNEHMLAKVPTNAGTLNCCPMCYSECYEDPRGIPTEYTISYVEVIKHEVKVTAMSRAQAERIILSNKHAIERKTRLPQVIGKSITSDGA
jgi:hypothetical protein